MTFMLESIHYSKPSDYSGDVKSRPFIGLITPTFDPKSSNSASLDPSTEQLALSPEDEDKEGLSLLDHASTGPGSRLRCRSPD
jgi:hypothetical protein